MSQVQGRPDASPERAASRQRENDVSEMHELRVRENGATGSMNIIRHPPQAIQLLRNQLTGILAADGVTSQISFRDDDHVSIRCITKDGKRRMTYCVSWWVLLYAKYDVIIYLSETIRSAMMKTPAPTK